MVSFETEAREFLLKRRRRLRREPGPDGAVPTTHWFETEALPEPVGEEARRELARIDAALERIEAGSFGTCLACGGPMGLQRMRAIPEARYCLGCSGQVPEAE
jgi:RNA polymerase-binding transcription factor DksA